MVNKNNKGSSTIFAGAIIGILVIGALSAFFYWNATHYSIPISQVGVVTDQFGGIIRIEKGPLGWAEKGIWESVKYYTVAVQTEDMISPATAEQIDNITINRIDPAPKSGLKYGALSVDTIDVSNVYIDISVQWHLDVTSQGWDGRLKTLYTNYPDESYAEKTLFSAVRDYARDYIQILRLTTDELVFTNRTSYSTTVTAYVQNQINEKLPTLGGGVVLDQIFIRRVTPPETLQVQYAKVLEAQKQAEAILTLANATRDASIQIATGQSVAINLVVNATSESILHLQQQGLNTTEAVQYLQLQYVYDSLKKIADSHPDWKLTIFINSPQATYTVPITGNP